MPRTRAFNEEEVLKKAMEYFWKDGFHATSMDELLKHMGISRASFYATFGNKRKLFERVLTHYSRTSGAAAQTFIQAQPDVRIGLKALLMMAIEEAQTDEASKGCFVVNSITEMLPGDDFCAQTFQQNREEFERIMRVYLAQGVADGQLSHKKDLAAIATLIFTFYNGLRIITKVKFDAAALAQSIDHLLKVLD